MIQVIQRNPVSGVEYPEVLTVEYLLKVFEPFGHFPPYDRAQMYELRDNLAHTATARLLEGVSEPGRAAFRGRIDFAHHYQVFLRAVFVVASVRKQHDATFIESARAWSAKVRAVCDMQDERRKQAEERGDVVQRSLESEPPPSGGSGIVLRPRSLESLTFNLVDYPFADYPDVLAAALSMFVGENKQQAMIVDSYLKLTNAMRELVGEPARNLETFLAYVLEQRRVFSRACEEARPRVARNSKLRMKKYKFR